MSVLAFFIGTAVGIIGTVVYNHFQATKVAALGDEIVTKVDPLQKK